MSFAQFGRAPLRLVHISPVECGGMSWLRFLRTGNIGEITAPVPTNPAQSARKAASGAQGAEHAGRSDLTTHF